MKDKFAVTPEQLGRIGKLNRVRSDEEVTLAMVENGNITAANIVKQYGDQYLPIFARMDDELKKRKSLIELKQKALEICEESEW